MGSDTRGCGDMIVRALRNTAIAGAGIALLVTGYCYKEHREYKPIPAGQLECRIDGEYERLKDKTTGKEYGIKRNDEGDLKLYELDR